MQGKFLVQCCQATHITVQHIHINNRQLSTVIWIFTPKLGTADCL